MKKCIISHRVYEDSTKNERRDCLDQRWQVLAEKLGVHMYPLPTTTADVDGWCSTLAADCVILSGGNSLALHGDTDMAPEKDESETLLVEWAMRNFKPVLGVCRGAQLINHAFGGSEIPVTGHTTAHDLNQTDDIFGVFPRRVNSSHRYGITPDTIVKQGDILATCDTVVEAFHMRDYKIWGIMWHPERDIPHKPEDIKFLKTILELE